MPRIAASDGALVEDANPFNDETLVLARWVRERLEPFAEDATAAIWNEVPAYRVTELKADVAAHCAKIFGVFVTTIEEQRRPTIDDFPWTAEHARRRVDHGISLSDFLQAFRIAQLTLWEHLQGYARHHGQVDDILIGLVAHVMRTIEAGSSAAARTYIEAQQYDVADHERIQRDLIENLLDGIRPSTALGLAILRESGIDDEAPFVAGAVRPSVEPNVNVAKALARSARNTLDHGSGGIFVVRQNEVVALIPLRGQTEANIIARLSRLAGDLEERAVPVSVGLSTTHIGFGSVPDAYAESQLACDCLDGSTGVSSLSGLSTLDYLVRRPDQTARRLVRPAVVAFFTEDIATGGIYAESLRAFIEHDLNAKEAAKALHVHVNTMYYRLDRIASRTECDLRKIDKLIELLLAVRILTDSQQKG